MEPDALYADVLRKYTDHINPYLAKLAAFAGFGVEIYAEGCTIVDHEGRRFLDCLGGYGTFSLGHRHPVVVDAVKRQLDEIALSGKAFFTKPQADLAARLAELTPRGLDFCFFNNSGAEAVEAALKFAKVATGRSRFVSTEGSYHGKTIGALSVTGREKYRKKFEPLMPGASFVPFGDAEAAAKAIDGDTAAMIVEPVQGEGGIIVPPDGYLCDLRAACDRHGALLIFDEVQSGLGRTGYLFACEHDGVSPDLMTLAKALGGGIMPIGAVIGTREIWDAVYGENPLHHTSTFGGNALACAAALAALDVLVGDRLWENSTVMGQRLKDGLARASAEHGPGMVREVRGRGLMVGVEFAQDEVGELVVSQLLKRGLCVAYALNNPRVLRFEPPLIITADQIDEASRIFGEALAETVELLAMLA
jgi:putrescine aminotransferase